MYSLFENDAFFKTDWNTEINSKRKKKHTTPKISKPNPNRIVKDYDLNPYLEGAICNTATGTIRDGMLKLEITGITKLIPISLYPFGDLKLNWTFERDDEIVFSFECQKFKGNIVGSWRDNYILFDLIENSRMIEHWSDSSFLPYTIKYGF